MIKLIGISCKYDNRTILKGINLDIYEGDFIAIIGHNGSGKTTLVKHLNALLVPDRGDIFVDNIDTKKNSWEIRKKVGIVFQNPEDQLINSIVEEDVAFGLENLCLPSSEIQNKTKNVLQKLNISHLAKDNVNNLSFGQKQLVALAGGLVMEPSYIIFDEPASMLDPKHKQNIMGIMRQLNKQGKTIILVTNNLIDIAKYVKRVVVLSKGEIMFDDKKSRLSNSILKKAEMYVE